MQNPKAKLDMLLNMPPLERRVYLTQETVASENRYLQQLLDWWKEDRSATLTEIREQRRRVQAWSKRLNEARRKLTESESNDKPSK